MRAAGLIVKLFVRHYTSRDRAVITKPRPPPHARRCVAGGARSGEAARWRAQCAESVSPLWGYNLDMPLPELLWERLNSDHCMDRARLPGGWLVRLNQFEVIALTFYPDPTHSWDGGSASN